MDAKRVIVVILAYGLWGTNKRSPKEVVGYGKYLAQCTQAIWDLHHCGYTIHIILCGGATQNGETEAESMFDYFYEAFDFPHGGSLEERSLTTPANIWEAYRIIKNSVLEPGLSEKNVLFFCDGTREFQVRWLVNKWLAQARKAENRSCRGSWSPVRSILSWPKPEVVGFDRPDINRKSTKIFQLFKTLVLMFYPWILRKSINRIRKD